LKCRSKRQKLTSILEGRTEARLRPGKKQVGTPMFERKVFWSNCTVLKKAFATLLGLSAPGALCPWHTTMKPFSKPWQCMCWEMQI